VRWEDIPVAAIGKEQFVKAERLKPRVTAISVGAYAIMDATEKIGQRLVGDLDIENIKEVAGTITPIPREVGSMTIAMPVQNTCNAVKRSLGLIR
jgi:5,10-methylene-tetrahydrofolate dehydrogenase/methenyl tetrahydrofolate cyclohydrolase